MIFDELLNRMNQDLQLRGMADSTQHDYLRAVRKISEHFEKPPDLITEDELRIYFLYLKNERNLSRSASAVALCGIKFFYTYTLQRDWPTLTLVRAPRENKLPVVLSRHEVNFVLSKVHTFRHRACLKTIYSCGLRLNEGIHLQAGDINSDPNQMLVHVRYAKGGRQRFVPLPRTTLNMLRELWMTHRNPDWLFPATGRGGGEMSMASAMKPVSRGTIQEAFRAALKESGIRKRASVHTLRHSYATHLLEKGVNLRLIQQYLGHRSPRATAVYTHLTKTAYKAGYRAIEELMTDI